MLVKFDNVRSSILRASRINSFRRRQISTLKRNPHIYIHTQAPQIHVLSYLRTVPPSPSLSIGTVHAPDPEPTPDSLIPNPSFMPILHSVLRRHATSDPDIQAAARAYASAAVASMGVLSPGNPTSARRQNPSAQQQQRGGWIHVSDSRCPPDWARVAWPEDIFGSLEVDGQGGFVDAVAGHETVGRYQESGTYRIVTREGILGLSSYLREKLVERLRELESGQP